MLRSKTALMFVLGLAMLGATTVPAMAQDERFDPVKMRERNEARLKESLGVTQEEWKVLQPKIAKLREAQRLSPIGLARRVGLAPIDPAPQGPVAVAARELQATVEKKDSTPEQIKVKLQALQDAKAKADADVVAAEAEVKALLNARQEAVMVSQGLLD
jgi:hypothetical protein